ncbi:MAG: ABC transporter ATP-binding protein, partial [Coriobacteriales bacterium]
MIELRHLSKTYRTGSLEQRALDDVSISFRDSEFVAVLGPSGSGKTTLLNIIGGLDHSDTGEIVVNGVSTRRYRSGDWDTYRNHHIGFIFQSYNLIPHQTLLANVELALTLAGVPRAQRRERARQALEQVGLGEQVHKKPGQLSGGQMQRVAIARALVNNPDIVLADEPTGALDSETGVQVMELLKGIAADRLVIMVTHNPELASAYATRTVRLSDGHVVADDDPYVPADEPTEAMPGVAAAAKDAHDEGSTDGREPEKTAEMPADEVASRAREAAASSGGRASSRSRKKASMSFLTALSLSFSNLMTKKGRTFLTAFAGSIGIIGIAAILALSNGVNDYIEKTEQDALSAYPLTITKSSFDMSQLLMAGAPTTGGDSSEDGGDSSGDAVIPESTIMSDMFAQVKNNDLSAFRSYLESGQSDIDQYVNTIQYDYGITPYVYSADTSNGVELLNPGSMSSIMSNGVSGSALDSRSSSSVFTEMVDDQDLLSSQMDVVCGRWPSAYDECVLVLSSDGTVSDYTLYSIGVYDPDDMVEMTQEALDGEKVTVPELSQDFTYDDALGLSFKVVPAQDRYQRSGSGTWTDMSDDDDFMSQQVASGIDLKVVGVVRPNESTRSTMLSEGIAYTSGLTDHLIDLAAQSDIVRDQMADPSVDVFTGQTFDEMHDNGRQGLDLSSMFSVDEDALASAFDFDASGLENMGDLSVSVDTDAFAQALASAPQPDLSSSLGGTDSMSDTERQQLNALSAQLLADFEEWYLTNGTPSTDSGAVSDAFQEYLNTPDAQNIEGQMMLVVGQGMQAQVSSALQDYMTNVYAPYLSNAVQQLMQQAQESVAGQMQQLSSSMQGMSVDADALAGAIQFNMTSDDLASLISSYADADNVTYDGNLSRLEYADWANPSTIRIYPRDFDAKESVLDIIDGYNDDMEAAGNDDLVISYSDLTGTLMSSVTSIV